MANKPYRKQSFNERFSLLGDTAENVFQEIAPLGAYQRLGWRRPRISMKNMSDNMKHMPDYMTGSGHLVEVMGLGRDGILKLKETKWEGLKWWNSSGNDVVLFVWNSHLGEWALIGWASLKRLTAKARAAGIESFEVDGNTYYPIRWEWIKQETPTVSVEE